MICAHTRFDSGVCGHYDTAPMPALRPDRVDVDVLAAEGASVERRYRLDQLSRLSDLLAGPGGEAIARFSFARVAGGVASCELAVEAVATLKCQRCLEPYEQPLASSVRLAFVAGDDAAPVAPEGFEAVPTDDGRIDIDSLVADELLLSMPIVPLHGGGTRCAETARPAVTDTRDEPEPETHRPFAQLQDLLKH